MTDGEVAISLEETAEPSEVEAVKAVVRDFNLSWNVSASYATKTIDPVSATIIITGAASMFFAGMLGEAGKDAWRRLKRFVRELRGARPGKSTQLVAILNNKWIVFPENDPEDAFRRLCEINVTEVANESDTLVWDEGIQDWRDSWSED